MGSHVERPHGDEKQHRERINIMEIDYDRWQQETLLTAMRMFPKLTTFLVNPLPPSVPAQDSAPSVTKDKGYFSIDVARKSYAT